MPGGQKNPAREKTSLGIGHGSKKRGMTDPQKHMTENNARSGESVIDLRNIQGPLSEMINKLNFHRTVIVLKKVFLIILGVI